MIFMWHFWWYKLSSLGYRFLHCEVTVFLSVFYSLEANNSLSHKGRVWLQWGDSISCRKEYLHKLNRILLWERFVSSPFIYPVTYCMDLYIHFILCISNTVLLLKLFHPWLFGSSFRLAPLSLWHAASLSDTTRCFRFILYFPCPSLRISHFTKEP